MDKCFFENDPLYELKKDATRQKVLTFQEVGQKHKMVIEIEFTPHSLSDWKNSSPPQLSQWQRHCIILFKLPIYLFKFRYINEKTIRFKYSIDPLG